MTMKETVRQHREAGRGRKAFWIAAGLVLIATVVWLAPARAGRQETMRHGGWWRAGHGPRGSFGEAAAELRRHADLLHRAGLSGPQVERIATLIDRSSPALQEFDTEREALAERAAEALSGDTLDATEIASLEAEATRLAAEVIHDSLGLIVAVAAELTQEQRAQLIEKWKWRQ